MTKTKSTKRALLMSALSLLMCVSMLIGSTFAWFTDSVASGSNVITAGNLDIAVEYTLDGTNWNDLDGADDLFHKGLWEPGHTEVVALRIKNNGTLALKYVANMNIVNETVGKTKDGADIVLSDILTVDSIIMDTGAMGDVMLGVAFGDESTLQYTNTASFKNANVLGADEMLLPGTSKYLIVKVDMAETVGNEANHDGVHIPSIEFGINVLATQFTYENDSFGNQYDANAPEVEVVVDSTEELEAALTAGKKIIGVKGSVELAAAPAGQNRDMDHVTLVGLTDDATITVTGNGGGLDNLNLKDIKVVDSTFYIYENGENAWEFTYLELGGTATYTNVVFDDGVMSDGSRANFVNCTFNGHNNDSSAHGNVTMYGAWVYNGEATFTNCTFVGTRGLKVCDQYAGEVSNVVVDGCLFDTLSEKPGLAIDDRDANSFNIVIKNSFFINCQAGDQSNYIYETDNYTPVLENNKVFNNATVVASAEELKNALNTTGNIVIIEDIAVKDGSLVHTYNSTQDITINGNGATIESSASSVDAFQWEGGTIPAMSTIFSSADGSKVTVNDLSFTGTMSAIMLGHYQNATYNNYNTVLNNVNVIGAKVVSFSSNTAPAVCVYGTATLNNCNIYGTTLSELDTDPMWPVYDLAAVNYTDLTVNDSKIGSLLMWNQAKVTVADGTEVDTVVVRGNMNTTKYGLTIEAGATVGAIDLSGITDKAKINITIEDGANVGKIIANGVEYATLADWQNA